MRISVEINGRPYEGDVEPRTLLSDFIRHGAGLHGTHVGCEQVCGACTVQLDGEPVRSCLMLAVQANGRSLRTVEASPRPRAPPDPGSVPGDARPPVRLLHAGLPHDHRSLPPRAPAPDRNEIREALAGNLCRCTGYKAIIEAVERAAERLRRP